MSLRQLLDVPPSAFIALVDSPLARESLREVDRMAEEGRYPVLGDLVPAVYVALVLCVLRWGLHKCFFRPMAIKALKLEPVSFASHSPLVEDLYKKKMRPSVEDIHQLIPKLEDKLTVGQLQQEFWLRRRRDSQELRITKFVEALWRCIFYAFFTVVGFFTLYYPVSVPWVESPLLYFDMWPVEPLDKAVQLYYLLELGSYIHQLMWTDVSRSDSVEMMTHHIITILLISVSYVLSFIRIGTMIMIIHDVPDVFLEAGKCMNYIGKAKNGEWMKPYTDVMFGIFATLFFISRIVIYPSMIYYANTVSHIPFGHESFSRSYLFFITLLLSLQALHVFWFYLILRMAYRLLWLNGGTDDIRSDDDDEEELQIEEEDKKSPTAVRKRSKRPQSKKEQ